MGHHSCNLNGDFEIVRVRLGKGLKEIIKTNKQIAGYNITYDLRYQH